jgi:hypothetical protein
MTDGQPRRRRSDGPSRTTDGAAPAHPAGSPAASSFAADLRSHEPGRAAAAWHRLRRTVASLARTHPRFHGLTGEARDDAIHEVASEYALQLLENPARLAAATVQSWGLLKHDLRRFLRDVRGQGIETASYRLPRHFRDKVGEALREGAPFVRLGPERWTVDGAPAPSGAAPPPDDELDALLPRLPSRLEWGREDQLAPLADARELREQLARILRLAGWPLTTRDLARIAWRTLDPPPQLPRPTSPPRPGHHGTAGPDEWEVEDDWLPATGLDPEQGAHQHRWEARVDGVAWRIVERLSPRTRSAARIRFGEPGRKVPLDEIAARMNLSRGTIDSEVGTNGLLRTAFQEAVQEEESAQGEALSELQRVQLEDLVLETLRNLPEDGLEQVAAPRGRDAPR